MSCHGSECLHGLGNVHLLLGEKPTTAATSQNIEEREHVWDEEPAGRHRGLGVDVICCGIV